MNSITAVSPLEDDVPSGDEDANEQCTKTVSKPSERMSATEGEADARRVVRGHGSRGRDPRGAFRYESCAAFL
jgi:hypothetical protein